MRRNLHVRKPQNTLQGDKMRKTGLFVAAASAIALFPVIFFFGVEAFGQKNLNQDRQRAGKLMQEGNYRESFEIFSALALDPADDPGQVPHDMEKAVSCLANLGRTNEFDGFIEKAVRIHSKNWKALAKAGRLYMDTEHYGSIVAGEFIRGPHRGPSTVANSFERDRVRAMQLYRAAIERNIMEKAAEREPSSTGEIFLSLSGAILGNRGWSQAWRLQYITDMNTLPDVEEGYYMYDYRTSFRGAPVNPDGTPVFHMMPESWESAGTDGERFRWCLAQASEYAPELKGRAMSDWAGFLHAQFGVETMGSYRFPYGRVKRENGKRDESGPYAVSSLEESETISKLANGIKRFKLPEEFNHISIYRQIADEDKTGYAQNALYQLSAIFENRMQYEKAAGFWERNIREFSDPHGSKKARLDQITGNWGRFDPAATQPAGSGASVEYIFRNGKKVRFTAREINISKLLADTKKYIESKPRTLEWNRINVQDIGYRLVTNKEEIYAGRQVAEWELELEPREGHFNRVISVSTPLQKAGAYLLTALMEGGNRSSIVLWVADTAIVKKQMDNATYYYVADAETGLPVPGAKLEFFGYRQRWRETRKSGEARYETDTREFSKTTDPDGQAVIKADEKNSNYTWLITATAGKGRFAYMGFTGMWTSVYRDPEYNQVKYYFMSDRPAYRPGNSVKFKWWINTARYEQEGKSSFAGQRLKVGINNPRGEKVFEKSYSADDFGGIDGEFLLPEDAVTGIYSVTANDRGMGTFRVEEYKKPEFEVKVEAPAEPVRLGDKITARIEARYYFGPPVKEGKVTYKVFRSSSPDEWYPPMRWDWLYGKGYGWFGYNYEWYPGWADWGCFSPWPWWRQRPREQPELVAEMETEIGEDGIVKVEIDTGPAKEMLGDTDHIYEITAEVTDMSRRTISGHGTFIAARKPFKVYAWTDRGHYRAGDDMLIRAQARTPDGKPVTGKGIIKLLKISYVDGKPRETEAASWSSETDGQGEISKRIKVSSPGQYRVSCTVTDGRGNEIEGGYIFSVRGKGSSTADFHFNDLEIVPDRAEYKPGEKASLMINTARAGGCVLLFHRPSNGVYLPPRVIRMESNSITEELEIVKKDMPNIFVEAVTVSGGKVFQEARELAVPPENRILEVSVEPSMEKYRPGERASLRIHARDSSGSPYRGSLVITMYDKSVEYISTGSNVPDIREFFWKWRRHHYPSRETSLDRMGHNISDIGMQDIGIFGHMSGNEDSIDGEREMANGMARGKNRMYRDGPVMEKMMEVSASPAGADTTAGSKEQGDYVTPREPAVRSAFADTALWVASVETDGQGNASAEVKLPENLTSWKTRVWAMGEGSRVGEGSAGIVTTKNFIVRLQSPRFFVEKDEVVLSANVHNYLDSAKNADLILETEGGCLEMVKPSRMKQRITISAGGEKRVDWRVRVIRPGEAVVRIKGVTDEESDAVEMRFPAYVHGMLKTESWSGHIRQGEKRASLSFSVPAERRPEETRLEIRYSPTLAAAMVDALPYLADYPYGCTEQTLNRFLPAAVTKKTLLDMKLDLGQIREKRTNLNPQETGTGTERAKEWKRPEANPVFDEKELERMVAAGITRLAAMQSSDGGWGWFSGWGEKSWPHTTATVVHGLQVARACDAPVPEEMLGRGEDWLRKYQDEQVQLLENAAGKKPGSRWKTSADNIDALVYMTLVDANSDNTRMREFLYRDRTELSVYSKAVFGLALHRAGDISRRDMLMRNISQYVVEDSENQTAYLKMPENNCWWLWHGSETEAHAYYLKLLAAADPSSRVAPGMVKYLLNNRKHATYWDSTRDTALVIEAFSDYLKASGEDSPDMSVTILVDGRKAGQVLINRENLFTFNNLVVLYGDEITTGRHTVELRKEGTGPLYFNVYLSNFTLEEHITKAGLEIRTERKYYRLAREEKKVKAEGMSGQALDQRVEKYRREELKNLDSLKSGDLVEVELKIESKNDYEYIMLEDMKAAGFEPVDVRSGYSRNGLGAYMELRDEKVSFFARILPRGTHSISYRMRAEVPGKFSALPAKASGMYAPELKANSDEIKLLVTD